jgi:hypothetical protein
MEAADLSVIGIGKGDIADDPVGMKTDPFMCRPVVLMELLHGFGVELGGKGEAEQGVDPGAVFNGQSLYLHAGSPRDGSWINFVFALAKG